VTRWEAFRRAVYTRQVLRQENTSLPRQFLIYSRFTSIDSGHVWILIEGYINKLCDQTSTDLRMGVPPPKSNIAGL
jgi:hypothetical protein